MQILAGRRQTLAFDGVKYQKFDNKVDIEFGCTDDHFRGIPSAESSCCLNWLDWFVSGFLWMLLCAYRRVAKRYPRFLEDNGLEFIQEGYQRLQNQNDEMKQEVINLKNEISIKIGAITQLEQKNSLNMDIIRQRDKKIVTLEQEKRKLEEEKQEALTRLSEQMAIQLRDKNPNIVDLNDKYRPTKLAEMFTELYDNEWTDAFSFLDRTIGEEHSIVVLLDIFMEAYTFCQHSVAVPWTVLNKWFLDMNIPGAKQVSKWLKDSRKANISNKTLEVKKEFIEELISRCHDSKISSFLTGTELSDYITKCIELCLLMITTDPPVIARCQVWAARNNRKGNEGQSSQNVNQSLSVPNAIFDKELFKEYTTRGNYLDYIVWPALFLHNDGPLLSKGIAQGREDLRQKQKLWTWKK